MGGRLPNLEATEVAESAWGFEPVLWPSTRSALSSDPMREADPMSETHLAPSGQEHQLWRAILVQPAFAQLRIHEMPNESSHMPNRPEGMSLGGTVTLPSCESAVNNVSSSPFELQSMNTEKLLP